MNYQAVFFDLGETLLNYGNVNVNALFKDGSRLTYDFLSSIADGNTNLPAFKTYNRSHIFTLKLRFLWSNIIRREFDCLTLLNNKARKMGFNLSADQLSELSWLWYQPLGDVATIESDLPETLQTLTDMGLQLAIISNTFLPASVLDRQLDTYDLRGFFPTRTYSSDTIVRKPNQRIYQTTLQQLNLDPDKVIMVGDKIPEDIKGPSRLGIKGIFKRGLTNQTRRIPVGVHEIDHIAQLPDLIKSWG